MRLAKYLAHSGIASRRAAEGLIADGRVAVGGEVVTDPARDVDEHMGVTVDGDPVAIEEREAWAVNKPEGVVSTAADTHGRETVVELVRSKRRLFPVGRLDADSSGLIILTNDGELANRLTHPRYEVERTYRVRLARRPTTPQIERLRKGVRLEDGPTLPARVRRTGARELTVTLREGRNRQIRRMALAVGNRVTALERVGIGSLELGELAPGRARRLGADELGRLWEDAAAMAADAKNERGRRR